MPSSKSTAFLVTALSTLGVGALMIYGSVKKMALNSMMKDGTFKNINIVHGDRLAEIHRQYAPDSLGRTSTGEKRAMNEEDWRWRKEAYALAKEKHKDDFSGAWSSLSSQDRAKAVAFTGVTMVTVGVVTHLIGKSKGGWSGAFDGMADGLNGVGHYGGFLDGGGHFGL